MIDVGLVGRMLARATERQRLRRRLRRRRLRPGASARDAGHFAVIPATADDTTGAGGASAPAPTITPELKALLRQVKLGRTLDTLPERLRWPAPPA